MSIEQDLMAVERQLWTGGPAAYQTHLDQRCLVTFKGVTGLMAKEDIAQSAEEGRWRDVSMRLKGFVSLSDTAVVVTYECTATRKDDQPWRTLVSSGYVKRPDGWKLAFHQQTPLD